MILSMWSTGTIKDSKISLIQSAQNQTIRLQTMKFWSIPFSPAQICLTYLLRGWCPDVSNKLHFYP
jgi:hypothetical protein